MVMGCQSSVKPTPRCTRRQTSSPDGDTSLNSKPTGGPSPRSRKVKAKLSGSRSGSGSTRRTMAKALVPCSV
jgi:hypothetical protein